MSHRRGTRSCSRTLCAWRLLRRSWTGGGYGELDSGAARRKPRPAQIGVEHGTGPKALDRLAEVGVKLPQGWVKRQDHAKHGIVAELPDGEDPSVVITWLIVASTLLRTVVEPGEDWIALVHEPDA